MNFCSIDAHDEDFSGVTPQGVPPNMVSAEVEHEFTDWLTGRITYEWYDDYYYYFAGSQTMATHVTPGVPRLARAALRWRF